MAVLRRGKEYRFSALDPKRGRWPESWQSRVASALARRGWRGTLIWLSEPVPWWTVLPSVKCGGDAVVVWLDAKPEGADLDTTLLEAALNEAIGCMELGEQVGDRPELPPDHAGEPAPAPAGTPGWLKAVIVGGVAYLGLSALAKVASVAASARRIVGVR